MAVGLQVSKSDVNQSLGTCARSVFNALEQVQKFKTWLDTQLDSDLISLGFTQAEVNTIRSAMVDLDQLRTVFQGLGTRTPAYDYRTFAKLTIGTGQF